MTSQNPLPAYTRIVTKVNYNHHPGVVILSLLSSVYTVLNKVNISISCVSCISIYGKAISFCIECNAEKEADRCPAIGE